MNTKGFKGRLVELSWSCCFDDFTTPFTFKILDRCLFNPIIDYSRRLEQDSVGSHLVNTTGVWSFSNKFYICIFINRRDVN